MNKTPKTDFRNLNFVPAKGTVPITVTHKNSTANVLQNKKRKLQQVVSSSSIVKKRQKTSTIELNEPKGFIWDAQNWSCAYDSLFTILLAIWNEDPSSWKKRFNSINEILKILSLGFKRSKNHTTDLETVRNTIRHLLHQDKPEIFPYGQVGIAISDLAHYIMKANEPMTSTCLKCMNCENITILENDRCDAIFHCSYSFSGTISACLAQIIVNRQRHKCQLCWGEITKFIAFNKIPPLIMFTVDTIENLIISQVINLSIDDISTAYTLRGIVYFGDAHFTARIFINSMVWFHDGISTRSICINEGEIDDFSNINLLSCNGNNAVLFIYAQF
jgi:hypothetical protein